MTAPRPILLPTPQGDPLIQLLAEHDGLGGQHTMILPSQEAALAHWPALAAHDGPVTIILRRDGRSTGKEWQESLDLLATLLETGPQDVRLAALTEPAAQALSDRIGWPVSTLPPMPKRYHGPRRLQLLQGDGPLLVREGDTPPLLARRYNLARLRRLAGLSAEASDPDLTDLAAFANGERTSPLATTDRPPVIVIVVPNGIGLGHVTRMLAVARSLRDRDGARVLFWSFSRAAGIIARHGFDVTLRQTAQHLQADPDAWLRWESEDFAAALADVQPDLVVQDGSQVDRFIVEAMARPGSGSARLALVRRGMWQPGVGLDALEAESLVDLVIEPGDLASGDDRGLTRNRHARTGGFATMARTAPVTLTRPGDMLDRKAARRALGLGRGRFCLVSLGGDAFGDWDLLLRTLAHEARAARTTLVWARSPLAAEDPELDGRSGMSTISRYPLAPCLQAFDGVISAAGYNSFHELMQLYRGPVLFAPTRHAQLDDQPGRAQYAARQGWALDLPEAESPLPQVRRFFDALCGKACIDTRPDWRDGAAELARALLALAVNGRAP